MKRRKKWKGPIQEQTKIKSIYTKVEEKNNNYKTAGLNNKKKKKDQEVNKKEKQK